MRHKHVVLRIRVSTAIIIGTCILLMLLLSISMALYFNTHVLILPP